MISETAAARVAHLVIMISFFSFLMASFIHPFETLRKGTDRMRDLEGIRSSRIERERERERVADVS